MSLRSFLAQRGEPLPGMVEPAASFEVDIPPELRQGLIPQGIAQPISRREALQVPAVLRGRNLICTLASLPMKLRNKDRQEREGTDAPTTLFDQVDPDVPNVVVMANTYEDLLFHAESWWHVLERNFNGWPTFAEHVDKSRVAVDASTEAVYLDGRQVTNREMIRFYGPNPALLIHAARAIRVCHTLDQAAANYSDTPTPLGAFTPRDTARPKEDPNKIEKMLDKWEEARRRRVWGYIPAQLELKEFGFNARDIQLAEQRQHAVLEIARAIGVDPEDLGVSTTSRTYQNSEQRRQDLLDFTLGLYRAAVEQRLSMRDVTPRGWELKVTMDGFLRGDTKTRMETYAIGEPLGIYPPERLAELEDIPRVVPPKPAAEIPQNTRSIPQNDGDRRRLEVVD